LEIIIDLPIGFPINNIISLMLLIGKPKGRSKMVSNGLLYMSLLTGASLVQRYGVLVEVDLFCMSLLTGASLVQRYGVLVEVGLFCMSLLTRTSLVKTSDRFQ